MKLRAYFSHAFEHSVDLAREKYLKPYAKKMIQKDIESYTVTLKKIEADSFIL